MRRVCNRTYCIWKPRQQIEGFYCTFGYDSSHTLRDYGVRRCLFCHELEPERNWSCC